jgi:replicative DNA helicase
VPEHSPDPYRDRRPPWSEDAERAVLAAMIMSVDAIVVASER